MLAALADGERNPEVLVGRFNDLHAFMVRFHLDRIEHLEAMIAQLDARIDGIMEPFRPARDALSTLCGLSKVSAENILAEIGVDMSVFPTSARMASWARSAPRRTSPPVGPSQRKPAPGTRTRRDTSQSPPCRSFDSGVNAT